MQVAAEMVVLVLEEAADVKVRKLSVVRFDHHVEFICYSARLSRFNSSLTVGASVIYVQS